VLDVKERVDRVGGQTGPRSRSVPQVREPGSTYSAPPYRPTCGVFSAGSG
jgi:hypothetical protein